MAELKTKKNDAPVENFLSSIKEEQKRKDAFLLLEIIKEVTGEQPKMWGSSIIGFGDFHYEYGSGRTGEWFITGFSPRKQNITMYFCAGVEPLAAYMKNLGKYKTGVGCLYFQKLADVDTAALKEMLKKNMERVKKMIK